MSDQDRPMANELILVDLSDVEVYQRNPRNITERDVEAMAALIKAHGFRVPIMVTEGEGVWMLVDGHLRVRAARSLGIETVPAINVSDMTEAQIAAFRISVNRASELASWNTDMLTQELSAIRGMGDEFLTMTGFDDASLLVLLQEDTPAPPPVTTPVAGETVTRSADRQRVTSPDDKVKLVLDLTLTQRTTVMARLDEVMQTNALTSRGDALVHALTAPLPAVATTNKKRRTTSQGA